MTTSRPNIWATAADFPAEPNFYRRVLDQIPTPVIVVDELGLIVYCNEAMIALGEWSKEESIDANLLSYVHPDDVRWVANAFTTLAAGEPDRMVGGPWAPISLRLVARSGEIVQVEVTGYDRLDDEDIGGVLYHVRPMTEQIIERRVVSGLTDGTPAAALLADVLEFASLPPLELCCCLVAHLGGGEAATLAVAGDSLTSVVAASSTVRGMPESDAHNHCQMIEITKFGDPIKVPLLHAGFVTSWHTRLVSADHGSQARLIAFAKRRHWSTAGIEARLATAASLASAVLCRPSR